MTTKTAEKKAATAKRQREFRARMEEQGLVQVTGFVPAELAADMRDVMRRLCEERGIEVHCFRKTETGVMVPKVPKRKKAK